MFACVYIDDAFCSVKTGFQTNIKKNIYLEKVIWQTNKSLFNNEDVCTQEATK